MKPDRIRFVSSMAAVASSMVATAMPAAAQDGQYTRERGSLAFAAFITDRQTTTRLDSDTGTGSDIDLERELGLEGSTTVFRLGGNFWLGERHRFDLSAFDLSRTASRRIDETIVFGDQTFDVDTMVDTESDLTIWKTDYTYAVFNRDRGYLGLTGGLYIARIKLALSEAMLGNAESEGLTAPLPLVGLRGEYYLTERFALRGVAQWFNIDAGDVSGSLRDFYIAGDYRLGRRWSAGLAYNEVTMNITAEDTDGFVGKLDWGYDGWLAYVKYDFGR